MSTLMLSVSGARGIVGDGLDGAVAARLAGAFGRIVGAGAVVIGRDSRPSGPALAAAATAALEPLGCTIVDLGIVPTPTVQVAVETLAARGGIIVTASHNPPAWNALKFVGPDGAFLDAATMGRLIADFQAPAAAPSRSGPGLAAQRAPATRAASGTGAMAEFRLPAAGEAPGLEPFLSRTSAQGLACVERHLSGVLAIVDRDAIRRANLRVVVDAVHGAGGVLIAPLLHELGVAAEWIDGEPDGHLPQHPEPRAERLAPLAERAAATGAACGFALDPDGDRCAVVLPGRVLGEEWTLPLCAYGCLAAGERGPLVTNLSTSSRLEWVAERFGVPLHRAPVGEAHVVGRMRAVGALLGGEGNGGVIDPRVHLGRDAGVAIARLLGLEVGGAGARGGIAATAALFPSLVLLKSELALERAALGRLAEALAPAWGEPASREDGFRWSWPGGWAHLRPSGTEPIVRIMVEAPEAAAAEARLAEAREAARGFAPRQL